MLKSMFGQVFGSKSKSNALLGKVDDPAEDALMRAIAERRKVDPYVGAKLGAKEMTQRLLAAMKDERGVHAESLLCALGSLAGYACQAALRELASQQGLPASAVLMTVSTADGKKYYMGDELNKPLCEAKLSVWSLVGGAAQHNGCKDLPNLNEMFEHVIATLGEPNFGIPRTPADHRAGDVPINYVKAMWPKLLPVVKSFCFSPVEWPLLFAGSAQEVMDMSVNVLEPRLAVVIVMESAIPMSKVDLDTA